MKKVALLLMPLLLIPVVTTSAQDDCYVPAMANGYVEALQSAETLDDLDAVQANITDEVESCRAREAAAAGGDDVARDGLSQDTAYLLGEPGQILDGQGLLTINRFVRGANFNHARFLAYQNPDRGKEWLIVHATFTCQQSLCDPIEESPFFLVGDEQVIYGNLVLVDGGNFEDQLAGQALEEGSVSGWLWFQVTQTDSNFVLLDNGNKTHYFSLSSFAPGTRTVEVTSGSAANLRSCPSTDCDIVGTARFGDELVLLGEEGGWFHIRMDGGGEAYIFASLAQQ